MTTAQNPEFTHALVRPPGLRFAEGLTSANRGLPNLVLAREQHAAYCSALRALGVEVVTLDAADDLPDATFVEDTAVLCERLVVIANPGAPSRQHEVELLGDVLAGRFYDCDAIVTPGTLDGGDVCQVGSHFLVGVSARTNTAGADQLVEMLTERGYSSSVIDIRDVAGLLHLKSGVSWLGGNVVLVSPPLAHNTALSAFEQIEVPAEEAYAANCIMVNGTVLLPSGHPQTAARLAAAGFRLQLLDVSEFQKMDGGLSCLSLRYHL